MSYIRTAIAITSMFLTLAAVAPGARPAVASGGLAGQYATGIRALPNRPALQAPAPTPTPVVTVADPAPATIYAETPQQIETVAWTLSQLADAGFELPPVTIHMHSDRAGCSSDPERLLNGYYKQVDGVNIVHSCGNRWTLLHELAHVWDKTTLDDETRQLILDHQGLESWNHETWNQAGGEHLASIIAWAIDGTHPTRIGHYSRTELAEAYHLATGTQPPILVDESNAATSPPVTTAHQMTRLVQSAPTAPPDHI